MQATLKDSLAGELTAAIFHHTGSQVLTEQLEDAFITDFSGHPVHEHIMVNQIEKL